MQAEAALEEDPARKKLHAELSGRAAAYRERFAVLRAEKQELEDNLEILNSEELLGPQADAWRDRVRELRLEIEGLREDLDGVLEEIAELSGPY